jgi:hypothetical protein
MAHISVDIDDELVAILERMGAKRETTVEQTLNFLLERMLVGIPHQQLPLIGDYKPQHVPIMLDATEDRQRKAFRCINCGCAVFNYYGGVKLITQGVYDSNQNMVNGEDVDWFNETGIPTEIICPGRVVLQLPDGRTTKRRCSTVYYRIGV